MNETQAGSFGLAGMPKSKARSGPAAIETARNKKVLPLLFIAPALFFFILYNYYPFIKTIFMSLTITDASGMFKSFVGMSNYAYIFNRADFTRIILNTFLFVPCVAVFSMLVGFLLALFADSKVKGYSRFYEVLFSMPMAIASASAAIIWSIIMNPSIGALNYILGTDVGWLTESGWAFFSVTLITVWLQMAINFIFLLTGLRAVPQELKEAALIDGATGIKKLTTVTLPMISPTMFFVTFFNAMASFQAFGQIRLLTKGGPGISTRVMVYDIYLEAFMNFRFGTACAESVILFFMMLLFTLIQFRFEERGVHYA